MTEFIIFLLVIFGVSNLFFFTLFRKRNQKRNRLTLYTITSGLSIILGIYLIFSDFSAFTAVHFIKNILSVVFLNLVITGYFFLLSAVNSLIEKILIVQGYFTYTVIFAVFLIISSVMYYFAVMFFMAVLTLDYF